MKLVDGFYDFKEAAERELSIGKYPAWQAYYNKYKAAFDPLFSSLYNLDDERIQTIVGQLNFQDLLLQSERGRVQFPLKKIEAILKKCCTYFDFHEDFTVYLLTGWVTATVQLSRPVIRLFTLDLSSWKKKIPKSSSRMNSAIWPALTF
jgi:hypothetical protein